MVSHQRHSDTIGDFAINEMIWKTKEICAVIAGFDLMKSAGACCGERNHPAQFGFEFIS